MRGGSEHAAHGKGSRPLCVAKLWQEVAGSLRCVGAAQAGDRRADALSGSNPAKGAAHSQPRVDAGVHSPGAASPWRCPAIDTARATGRDGNCGCWPHTPCADCHRLLDAAPGHEAPGLLDSGGSHRAGEESLAPRSDPSSRRWPSWVDHTRTRVLMRPDAWQAARSAVGGQGQTRSCGGTSVPADAPAPGGGSTPIARPLASTPAPRRRGCTNDRGPTRYLHLTEQAQRRRGADRVRRHQRR